MEILEQLRHFLGKLFIQKYLVTVIVLAIR